MFRACWRKCWSVGFCPLIRQELRLYCEELPCCCKRMYFASCGLHGFCWFLLVRTTVTPRGAIGGTLFTRPQNLAFDGQSDVCWTLQSCSPETSRAMKGVTVIAQQQELRACVCGVVSVGHCSHDRQHLHLHWEDMPGPRHRNKRS